ncbi:MAG: thioesterase [Halobacteriovorax sp.]|nr:thioesterase [Halobacteriovorax sp.]|tara:strand:- start:214538 stop:214957 length:420 start_codon:yes stop_codon:yes gene_type:complete
MARVKIQFPDSHLFETNLKVCIDHINYGNHMGNDRFLSFAGEARLRFLKSLKQDEMNFYGSSLIMSDAEISYKAQVYHGDSIKVELAAKPVNNKSFDFLYRFSNQNNTVVSLVKTGMVYFDYDANRVCNGPEEWLRQLV